MKLLATVAGLDRGHSKVRVSSVPISDDRLAVNDLFGRPAARLQCAINQTGAVKAGFRYGKVQLVIAKTLSDAVWQALGVFG